MISRQNPFWGGVIWALLFLWLCFGSLALGEQMNVLAETSSQDEEALSQLASTLKPEVPTLGGPLISSVDALIPAPSAPISVAFGSLSAWILVHDLPALRPHQRVSVYRI